MNASEIQVVVNGEVTTLQLAINDILGDVADIKSKMVNFTATADNMDRQLLQALSAMDGAVAAAQAAATQNDETVNALFDKVTLVERQNDEINGALQQVNSDVSGFGSDISGLQMLTENHGESIASLSYNVRSIAEQGSFTLSPLARSESEEEASPNDMTLQ